MNEQGSATLLLLTDADDMTYILMSDEDIRAVFDNEPDMDETGFFQRVIWLMKREWVPAMELDGTKVLVNTSYIKKVSAKTYPPRRAGKESD